MRLRLLNPPPVTIHVDRDYRVDFVWMEAASSGYIAANFSGGHWKLTPNFTSRSALHLAWSTSMEILNAPWPITIAQALVRAGLAEVVQT